MWKIIILSFSLINVLNDTAHAYSSIERYCSSYIVNMKSTNSKLEYVAYYLDVLQRPWNPFMYMMGNEFDAVEEEKVFHRNEMALCLTASKSSFLEAYSDCAVDNNPGFDTINLLRASYCHKEIATKKSQLLESNHDVPAQFVSAVSDRILAGDKAHYKLTVTESLQELNEEAAKVWNKILKCADNDAEAVRAAFIKGKITCPDVNIESFNANLFNFFMQSELPEVKYFDTRNFNSGYADIIENDYKFYKMRQTYKESRSEMDGEDFVHPLIIQFALQLMTRMIDNVGLNSFFKSDKQPREMSDDYANLFKNLANFLILVNDKSCAPMGLWPSAGWATWSHVRENVVLMREKMFTWDKKGSQKDFKKALMNFYESAYIPDFGFVASNCVPVNLPQIYKESGKYLFKTYAGMDMLFERINVRKSD